MKLKGYLASIGFLLSTILNSSQSALHITGLHLLSSAKKKIYDFEKNWGGFHEFSWTQKIYIDGFPWSLGMEPKNCFLWDLKRTSLPYHLVWVKLLTF